MQFNDQDLRAAVTAGALDAEKLNPLLDFLGTRAAAAAPADRAAPMFDLAHLLWYAGALIVITAMGLFSTLAFNAMGGWALTATAVVYATVFAIAGDYLWFKRDLRVPGGLLIAIAVSMAPLAVYGVQDAMGMWGTFGRPGTMHDFYVWIKGSWVYMEIAAIVAAVIALRRYPFPFIVMIIWFPGYVTTALAHCACAAMTLNSSFVLSFKIVAISSGPCPFHSRKAVPRARHASSETFMKTR